MTAVASQVGPAALDPCRHFLDTQVLTMVLQATIQRAAIYSADATDPERSAFRATLRRVLRMVDAEYMAPVSDEDHIARIAGIADDISREHAPALRGGRFRIGPAQKALNLYLKYQWCLGRIPPPPHCPFDFMIIQTLPAAVHLSWTQLDSTERYRELVAEGRIRAGDRSLAEWELDLYDQLQPLMSSFTTPL